MEDYKTAINQHEKARHVPGTSDAFQANCLVKLALAHIKLNRATDALVYILKVHWLYLWEVPARISFEFWEKSLNEYFQALHDKANELYYAQDYVDAKTVWTLYLATMDTLWRTEDKRYITYGYDLLPPGHSLGLSGPGCYYNLGLCNFGLERYATAISYFEIVLEEGKKKTQFGEGTRYWRRLIRNVKPLLQEAKRRTGIR